MKKQESQAGSGFIFLIIGLIPIFYAIKDLIHFFGGGGFGDLLVAIILGLIGLVVAGIGVGMITGK